MYRKIWYLLFLCLPVLAVFAQTGRTANGELALHAYRNAFPDKTGEVAFIENDWTISAGGQTFFWAGGRLLPQAEKNNTDAYEPIRFWVYPEKAPSPASYSPQYVETLRSSASGQARLERKDNHRAFQSVLYGGLERREIEAMMTQVVFLGGKMSIHRDIVERLKRVEAEIRNWEGGKDFIASLGSIGGFNWREIAGTQRMSYHSWGLAVDIQPKRLGGKAIYWMWEMQRNKDWMLVPLENRWNPPDRVIEIFENEGFIWGGKWPFYDNMHFEYRPELLEFRRLLAAHPDPNAAYSSPRQDLHHVAPF
ncbi:MAG: M15 family metallopeptidase [Treponema sp.]|nr:M15 family metallopeptidase [Treponema sp.]